MYILYIVYTFIYLYVMVGGVPQLRILAPQYMCKTKGSEKSSNQTFITVKAYDDLKLTWKIGWIPLAAPTQRFTIILWRAIRTLEKKMNSPQPEHRVYTIKDDELLADVVYVFNVTGTALNGEYTTSSFNIDYLNGDQKLKNIDGRQDGFSLQLLGGENTYADMEYIMEAHVTICTPTQDYHFNWNVYEIVANKHINISNCGSRLEIQPYTLTPGQDYNIYCQIIKSTTSEMITQASLPVRVLHRPLEVYLSIDTLIIAAGKAFSLESYVKDFEEYEQNIEFQWLCYHDDKDCGILLNAETNSCHFPRGLPDIGDYIISLTVNYFQQSVTTNATITTASANLPVIQVEPVVRGLNRGDVVTLSGNVSNITPSCKLVWYFAEYECLAANDTKHTCQEEQEISDSITVYSIEENFLNEITDYTNDTQWRVVTASLVAASGRARLAAHCGCSETYLCEAEGVSYADINLYLKDLPQVYNVMVTPSSGVALETMFRISSLKAQGKDIPMRYSFYCQVGDNVTLLLASYMDHLAVETYLPYVDGGVEVFVQVCNSVGGCSVSAFTTVRVQSRGNHASDTLLSDIDAYIRRCESHLLERTAMTAIVSYTHANQLSQVSIFTEGLIERLPHVRGRCLSNERYVDMLSRMSEAGIDTSSLM